jgi:hypothetical protein
VKGEPDQYSEAETERRFKNTLKRMLNTPPKRHAESAPKRKKKKPAKATPGRAKTKRT